MLKYRVYVNDDYYDFTSYCRLSTSQIAILLEVNADEIIQIDFEDDNCAEIELPTYAIPTRKSRR